MASADFPCTTGGAREMNGGFSDAFVARLSATLIPLSQATYLGGSSSDAGTALAIHPTSMMIAFPTLPRVLDQEAL